MVTLASLWLLSVQGAQSSEMFHSLTLTCNGLDLNNTLLNITKRHYFFVQPITKALQKTVFKLYMLFIVALRVIKHIQ